MSYEFHAIYENGVLRLIKPLDLPEQTPVHGFVAGLPEDLSQSEVVQTEELAKQRQSLDALQAKIDEIPQVANTDGLSNRDHDALLYGQGK